MKLELSSEDRYALRALAIFCVSRSESLVLQ
jgi:hypothetical protein